MLESKPKRLDESLLFSSAHAIASASLEYHVDTYVPAPSGLPLSARNDVAKMIVRWLCVCVRAAGSV